MPVGPWITPPQVESEVTLGQMTKRTWRTQRNGSPPTVTEVRPLVDAVFASADSELDRSSMTALSGWDSISLSNNTFGAGQNLASDVHGALQTSQESGGEWLFSFGLASQVLSVVTFPPQELTYPQPWPTEWPEGAIDFEVAPGGSWLGPLHVTVGWSAASGGFGSPSTASTGVLRVASSALPDSYQEALGLLAGGVVIPGTYAPGTGLNFNPSQTTTTTSMSASLPLTIAVGANRDDIILDIPEAFNGQAVFARGARVNEVSATRLYQPPDYRFIFDGPVIPPMVAMWGLRQRQSLAGNAGGWPSRQRQNGGATGSWPLRQRQTGV